MPSSTSPAASSIADEKFVSLVTFKRDGSPKPLPVWIAELPDGRLGFTTSGESWKAKRVKNDPRVTLRPCDQRGNVADDAVEVTGTAVMVDGAEFEQVRGLIKEKYGFMVTVITVMNKVRGIFTRGATDSSSAMIITLD